VSLASRAVMFINAVLTGSRHTDGMFHKIRSEPVAAAKRATALLQVI
jgi:hypothetical protein